MKLFSFLSKEKKEVPIFYQLGWWAHQQLMEITSFEVTIIESDLNLLNSVSLISYTVKGCLHEGTNGTPYIQSVQHAEYLIYAPSEFSEEEMTESPVHALIQLTPVVNIKNDEKKSTERVSFEFTNFYKIKSVRWGENQVQFRCGNIDKKIALIQFK